MDHDSQNLRVIAWMRAHGSITTMQAFDEMGITRLARCINDIRNGRGCDRMAVEDERVTYTKPDGTRVQIKRYRLAKPTNFDQQTGQGYLALP